MLSRVATRVVSRQVARTTARVACGAVVVPSFVRAARFSTATPPPANNSTPSSSQGTPFTNPTGTAYEFILTETRGNVGLITMNRVKQLNALADGLVFEIIAALKAMQADPGIGAIVITGAGKAFAAGADIKQMQPKTFQECYQTDMLGHWTEITKIRKPIIAAVNGYALGGGCELAMLCDIIIASDKAVFGQPEVKLGTIPGCGGTQRLIRAVGKSKAMELILTGDQLSAADAEKFGLVSRVVPHAQIVEEAVKMGTTIASYSQPIIAMAKEAVNAAEDLGLSEGIKLERRMFHSTFATRDQKEGMSAFIDKRAAKWANE